jgi:hypothetical protein
LRVIGFAIGKFPFPHDPILNLIASIDEFICAWQASGIMAPDWLSALRGTSSWTLEDKKP